MRATTILLTALALCASATPACADTLLSATRSGGFGGSSDALTISTKGVVRAADDRKRYRPYRLSERWLKRVKRHIRAARKANLRGQYTEEVSDGFNYAFSFSGGFVRAYGIGLDWPPQLIALARDYDKVLSLASRG